MTKYELIKIIRTDITNRKKEIISINTFVEDLNNIENNYYENQRDIILVNPNFRLKENIDICIKSFIVILYSHWEGFVKGTVKNYLIFLKSKGYTRLELHNCFTEYFFEKEKNNLIFLLDTLLNNSNIPIYEDMIDNILNLDYQNFKKLLNNVGFNFDNFIKKFEEVIKEQTGLISGKSFLEKIKNFKKSNHFLIKYIHNNSSSIVGTITLENIIKVEKENVYQFTSLLTLRHKIAHGKIINIDYTTFINLLFCTQLILETFEEYIIEFIDTNFDV